MYKRDANHSLLCDVLKKAGRPYKECSHLAGLGCDIIATHVDGFPVFVEIKRPGPPSARKLTESEEKLRDLFPQFYRICQSEEEVLRAVGLAP